MKPEYFLLCSLLLVSNVAMAEEEEEITPVTSGEGVVLEFEQSEEAVEETRDNEQREVRNMRRGGIEMIVGGQGEDGIAKRKQLQIID